MRVEPVASVRGANADSPARVEEPAEILHSSGDHGAHRRSRLGEDVVTFVNSHLAPAPIAETHPGSVPVVAEIDHRVVIRPRYGEHQSAHDHGGLEGLARL